jgi:hypothetical protein
MVVGFGWAAAAARADGDPASDVLVTQSLFLPFDAPVSPMQADSIEQLLAESRRDGYPLRVALIVSPADLGSVGELWRKPQSYADFLAEELSLVYRGTLLVVMPAGVGLAGVGVPVGAAQRAALQSVAAGGASLGAVALAAITDLASASGHVLAAPRGTVQGATGTDSTDVLAWAVFALGALLLGGCWTASLRVKPLRPAVRIGPLLDVMRERIT